jgi:GT2 family glycosyltransferase
LSAAPDPRAPVFYDADVVILSLDRPEETVRAIASALAQRGVACRVIVFDQGSNPDAFRRITDAMAGEPHAVLHTAGRNLGVPGGRNAAAALGTARVIVSLDNDAVFADSHTVARAVAALDDDPALGAIGMRIVVDSTGADDRSSWGYPASLLSRAGESFDTMTFVGAGHAIRRSAWVRAGGYDAALFFCWEEFDFCLRAIQLGWRVRYRGDIVVRHAVSPERRVHWDEARWFLFVRNRLYIERKWGADAPALVPRFLAYAVKGARHGLLGATMRAWPASARMAAAAAQAALSPAALAYRARTDRAHRGPFLTRLRREVLAGLPASG